MKNTVTETQLKFAIEQTILDLAANGAPHEEIKKMMNEKSPMFMGRVQHYIDMWVFVRAEIA